jgi:hypothetical protein
MTGVVQVIDGDMLAFDAANRLVAAGAAGPGCDELRRGLRDPSAATVV